MSLRNVLVIANLKLIYKSLHNQAPCGRVAPLWVCECLGTSVGNSQVPLWKSSIYSYSQYQLSC